MSAIPKEKDPIITATEAAIDRWAILARGYATDLGYPHCTVEQREIFGRGSGKSPEWPRDATEVEISICCMSHDMRKAMRLKYIYRFTDREAAKECHCSQPTFSARVKQGILFIAGRLHAKKLLD